MQGFLDAVTGIANESGFMGIAQNPGYLVMIVIACVLLYLAIVRQFEPLLLLPIAFGMLLANLPFGEIIHMEYFIAPAGADPSLYPMFSEILHNGGLADMLYLGVKLGIYPPLIFLGIGTMTDFGPLISNPKSLLLGAAAQLGIFTTYLGARCLGFTPQQAGSIGIIGGADGPTAIYVTTRLAPELLGAIAVAAYSYMALVPVIQPPIMKALTTKAERQIVMTQLRPVSKTEKILFPIMCTVLISLILPSCVPLIGMLMLGNLMKESGVVDRINKTLKIIALGLVAFCLGTAGGVLLGKVMCWATHGKVNPLIGAAGVSAVPMAARVAQKVGQKENPQNFLLMHAMGPNVAGVIGSAVAAGILINMLG